MCFEQNVDDFPSDRSGKENAAICQTAGDTGTRAELGSSRRPGGLHPRARPAIKRRVLGKNAACATRTRVGDRLDGLGTGPVPACRLLV